MLHSHDSVKYPVETPLPLFEFADRLADNASWTSGRLEYSVKGQTKVAEQQCWEVEAVDNFGRRQKFFVAENEPILVAAERRVFMGRGDEFTLRVSLSGSRMLEAAEAAKTRTAIASLQKIQGSLERSEGTTKPEL